MKKTQLPLLSRLMCVHHDQVKTLPSTPSRHYEYERKQRLERIEKLVNTEFVGRRSLQLLFAKAGEGYNAALPGHIGRDLNIEKIMIVEKDKAVSFHYTLKSAEGEQMETSREKDPMSYLHGANNIIPGLEKAMEGHAVNDEFSVTVEPEEAYGVRNENNVQRVPLKRLKGIGKVSVGQILNLQTNEGQVQVTVLKVGRFNVDVDGNHPLAGKQLTFEVEIMDIREASEEELEHRHVHGPGGHQH